MKRKVIKRKTKLSKKNKYDNGFEKVYLIGIIFIILVVAAGVFLLLKNNNTYLDNQNVQENQSANQHDFTSLNFKRYYEYFPITISDYQIASSDTGKKLVIENSLEYATDGLDTTASIESKYVADYVNKSDSNKIFRLSHMKFTSLPEANEAASVSDEVFSKLGEGFQKVNLSLSGVQNWAAYRQVPADKTDLPSGDARLLFKDALSMIIITTRGAISQSELDTIVKQYVDTILYSQTTYPSENEVISQ